MGTLARVMVEALHAPPLAPGSLLAGRYRVGAMLGRGGMATVHRATDEVLGREVAIKVLERAEEDPVARQREHAEIDMLATLSHRALVTVFDAATVRLATGTSTILVMELVDGPTLARRRADGPIADVDLVRLAVDVAEALAVVHARGIVHRDVKPSNILLSPSPIATREFDARLTDFGIATMQGGARLTATGTVLGTAAYLSPEQALGGRVTPAADVYALGLVLLEMITGMREFPGPALEALSARILRDPVMPAEVHPRWAALLTTMTAREPEDRPATEQVVHELAVLAHDRVPTMQPAVGVATSTPAMPRPSTAAAPVTTPLPASATSDGTRRPRRRLLLGVAGIAATVTALIGAAALQQSASAPTSPAEVADTTPPAAPSPSPDVDPVTAVDPVPAVDPGSPVEPAPVQEAPSTTVEVDTNGSNGNGGNGNNGNGSAGDNGNRGNNGNGSGGNGGGSGGNGGGNSGSGNGNG